MRKKKLLLNTLCALIKQIIFIICGFVLPKYMLLYFGSSVNGLVTSITQFLGFISFLDFGVGAVIQSNLYQPLADKDNIEISKILISTERFFRKIAIIFLIYILILTFIFPIFINSEFETLYTVSLIIIISISSFAQYYFGITYQLLLNADQRGYIPFILQTITLILNTVVSIIFMKNGLSIHAVKLTTAIIYLLRPFGQMIYVKRKYKIDKKIKLSGEPIKQKWNGFAQHLASVITDNTDVTLLSAFSTMQNVSVYSVYYNVVSGISNTVMTLASGLESMWGNMIAKKEQQNLDNSFEIVEWAIHSGCSFLFSVTGVLIVPFIRVYTSEISDADYIAPIFSALIVSAYGMLCLRVPYFRVIKAAGHYKETQNGSFIQAALNIVLSVALIFKFGLNGVALGTLIAMFFHTTYLAWYLRKNILFRRFSHYICYLVVDCFIVAISFFICRLFFLENLTYFSWVIMAIKVSLVCAAVCLTVNLLFYRKKIIKLFKALKSKKVFSNIF